MRATKAVIYRENLIHNINQIKKNLKTQNTKICVSVKADGYGCGALTAAAAALECGVSHLAVATVGEGRELREAGFECDILLYSPCSPTEIAEAVELKLTPFVFDDTYIDLFDQACAVAKLGEKFAVHLAVDTGMGRIGCFARDAAKIARKIDGSQNLTLGGMCTHFAVSDSTNADDIKYTYWQFEEFLRAVEAVRAAGVNPGIRHCAASAALLAYPEMQLDLVRPGIITYGYYPGDMTQTYLAGHGIACELQPVLALKTEIATVRDFAAGQSVSYGRTWQAAQKTKIATLPIGYADGLLRRFSPGLEVAISGKKYAVRGRICMDQCMIEVDETVKQGAEVVIFGPAESGALQTAQDLACKTGTISYEIMTSISKRVPRIVV